MRTKEMLDFRIGFFMWWGNGKNISVHRAIPSDRHNLRHLLCDEWLY